MPFHIFLLGPPKRLVKPFSGKAKTQQLVFVDLRVLDTVLYVKSLSSLVVGGGVSLCSHFTRKKWRGDGEGM